MATFNDRQTQRKEHKKETEYDNKIEMWLKSFSFY